MGLSADPLGFTTRYLSAERQAHDSILRTESHPRLTFIAKQLIIKNLSSG